ncbi:macrophage migration inhibitory factor-like [Corythoichthys intestinalis]|uniref:macrophage migration inhibitory factor-like n=1 Tax=Corythoichthys intestinalis TaxID=161448 RepID=UPI0025A62C71|nr:macrophage migration inhibitory factor-like [Corythoichthys intestinalis]XP_061793036.1 macrophage migration inhibitory factor-like [Nerophis lumbriciformis]
MSIFVVNTSVTKDKLSEALLSEATKELTKVMSKPAQFIAVHFHADQIIMIGGNADPSAICYFQSIEKLSCDEIKKYSKMLCGLVHKQLGISPERIYINFVDMDACNVACNNTTFG